MGPWQMLIVRTARSMDWNEPRARVVLARLTESAFFGASHRGWAWTGASDRDLGYSLYRHPVPRGALLQRGYTAGTL
jgi:hypothetical protein